MKPNYIFKDKLSKLALLLLMLFVGIETHAVPAYPNWFTAKQIDGTEITLRLCGDEHFHYYSTKDGVPVIKVNNAYYHATLNENDNLQSTGVLVHEPNARSFAELSLVSSADEVMSRIRNVWTARIDKANEARTIKHMQSRNLRRIVGDQTYPKGKKKGIVILVNYADLKMKSTSTRQAWDDQFNKKGYNKNGHIGSVRDYFYDQSYGQLDIDFDVVGPYTVSREWTYYGKQNQWGADVHPCQLVSEACRLANPDVNFKDYDWNGDGEVDQVFVVYAGYSAASGYSEDAIWPHEWHLAYGAPADGSGAITLDGVKIDNYALSSELNGTSGSQMDPIGTAVHEFSHCMGLPDFYDVDNSGTQCMDYWDVLDAGCYSGPSWKGEVPTGYTAYERAFCGWLNYTELNSPTDVTGLANLGDSAQAYIVYNKGFKNEYFILENRQSKKWFAYPEGCHGMLVIHVDYNKTAWNDDRPNGVPGHPRMTYVPADKSYSRDYVTYMASDFFPGTNSVRSITNTSHVNCYGKMFNKNSDGTYNMNMELTNIRETLGKISFTFNGGKKLLKDRLTELIASVQNLIDTPHSDYAEGATQSLQAYIAAAKDLNLIDMESEAYLAMADTLRNAAATFLFNVQPTDSLQPFDVTFAYINPAITSNEGWTEEEAKTSFNCSDGCGEYNGCKFRFGQNSLFKLPKGEYRATCQAFLKLGDIKEGTTGTIYTNFYARTKSVKLKNIVDASQEKRLSVYDVQMKNSLYVPGTTKAAKYYFDKHLYDNTIDFSIPYDSGSDVKIGIRCNLAHETDWTCFSNFKLYYLGDPTVTIIDNITAPSSAPNAIYDLSGRRITNPTKGIYIVNGKKVMY